MSEDHDLSFYLAALDGLSNPPDSARAAIDLAAALRHLSAVVVTSPAPPDVLAAAERTVRRLSTELGTVRPSAAERAEPSERYMNHPFYGPAHPAAVPMAIAFDGGITARTSYGVTSEGRAGQVHPGCLAAGVLSLVSLTAVSNGRRGRIRSVEMAFPTPAPLHTELLYRVAVSDSEEDSTRLSATAQGDDGLRVEATAVVAT